LGNDHGDNHRDTLANPLGAAAVAAVTAIEGGGERIPQRAKTGATRAAVSWVPPTLVRVIPGQRGKSGYFGFDREAEDGIASRPETRCERSLACTPRCSHRMRILDPLLSSPLWSFHTCLRLAISPPDSINGFWEGSASSLPSVLQPYRASAAADADSESGAHDFGTRAGGNSQAPDVWSHERPARGMEVVVIVKGPHGMPVARSTSREGDVVPAGGEREGQGGGMAEYGAGSGAAGGGEAQAGPAVGGCDRPHRAPTRPAEPALGAAAARPSAPAPAPAPAPASASASAPGVEGVSGGVSGGGGGGAAMRPPGSASAARKTAAFATKGPRSSGASSLLMSSREDERQLPADERLVPYLIGWYCSDMCRYDILLSYD